MNAAILIAFGVQALYWILLRFGFGRRAASVPDGPLPPMSVIVAARDEDERLPALLEALSRQTHTRHEVILIDDGSRDATPRILRSWQERMPGLTVVTTAGTGKKAALRRGIDAATYDLLAFTDADCEPPPEWLSTLAAAHASEPRECVVVGYSPLRGESFVQRVARYETFVTGTLTAAAAGLGYPYMAVGRNISYPRSVFERVGGFEAVERSLSGDDDLFVQHVVRCRAAEVRALLDPRSFVPSDAPSTWRAWLRQKRRHASAGRFYATTAQLHLAVFYGTSALVWLSPLFLGWSGVALLAAWLLMRAIAMHGPAKQLGELAVLRQLPVLDALYTAWIVLAAPAALAKVPDRW